MRSSKPVSTANLAGTLKSFLVCCEANVIIARWATRLIKQFVAGPCQALPSTEILVETPCTLKHSRLLRKLILVQNKDNFAITVI
mmetsp:Transcript_2568/g.5832  ORF Transcript_2568/g.5832 Transcript_2568/m.5832 type:complete len:85 (-) Transcript_2568:325-579(-)